MTLIIGSNGSMGRRYQAILKYLGEPFYTADIETNLMERSVKARDSDRIIIATPTNLHIDNIMAMSYYDKPILCEKPLSTDINAVEKLLSNNFPFTMMMQYSLLINQNTNGESYYDFYNHGKDGLIFDCIQIVGLANGPVQLKEDSPIWKCQINGYLLKIQNMDLAYVNFVHRWINKLIVQDPNDLFKMHQKCHDMEILCNTK